MAITCTYNTARTNVPEIFRATSGGTVFSANLGTLTAFDYFLDNAVVNDALYFSPSANAPVISDLIFNIGTPMAGTGIVLKWEYYKRGGTWVDMEDVVDDSAGFTLTGSRTVHFPLQWARITVTLNGLNRMWFRCRISALTTITEGGANSTTRVSGSNGAVTVSGGTVGVPATFTDIYNWCIANIPWVKISKRNDYSFNFTKIAILLVSTTKTTNEVIEIGSDGQGSQGGGNTDISYLTSGTRVGDRGYDGSTFIVYGNSNSGTLTTAGSNIYGSVFRAGKVQGDAHGYAGYFAPVGDFIDNWAELAFSFTSSMTVKNTRIVGALLIASNNPYPEFSGVFYITFAYNFIYLYQVSVNFLEFGYQFATGSGNLFYIYQNSGQVSPEWVLQNPSTPLNPLGSTVNPLTFSNYNTNISACKFYDTSAGTYTDYTTQATNATENDVPLTGDVGDYYLFGVPTMSRPSGFSLDFTLPNQANDYVYVWEYYYSGSWVAVDPSWVWDGTANLTKSGVFWTADLVSGETLATIDGVSGYWIRARIVTKGTATPVATKILQRQHSATSKWSLKEKWSVDVKVTDSNGNALTGATVVGTNAFGSFTATTNESGVITQQVLVSKEWHFDPINNPTTTVSENFYPTFSLTVSKAGYATSTTSGIALNSKVNTVVPLSNVFVVLNGLVAGSSIQIYDSTTATELYKGVVAGTSLSYTYNGAFNDSLRIRVRKVGYTPYEYIGAIGSTGLAMTLAQKVDSIYVANAIDGSTVTEFSLTEGVVGISINAPSNVTTGQRLYNWYNYAISTATFIDDQANLILAQTAWSYILDDTLKLKNTTANTLYINGANINNTSLNGSVVDTSGGNININGYFPFNSASDVATAVVNNEKTLTVGKFLALKK